MAELENKISGSPLRDAAAANEQLAIWFSRPSEDTNWISVHMHCMPKWNIAVNLCSIFGYDSHLDMISAMNVECTRMIYLPPWMPWMVNALLKLPLGFSSSIYLVLMTPEMNPYGIVIIQLVCCEMALQIFTIKRLVSLSWRVPRTTKRRLVSSGKWTMESWLKNYQQYDAHRTHLLIVRQCKRIFRGWKQGPTVWAARKAGSPRENTKWRPKFTSYANLDIMDVQSQQLGINIPGMSSNITGSRV